MDDLGSHRPRSRVDLARKAVALGTAACLLTSCSAPNDSDRAGTPAAQNSVGGRTGPAGPAAGAGEGLDGPPAVPPTDDPAALARLLDRVAATLRDRSATADDVRRAGELQQLAVLDLATASPAFRRKVTARLEPAVALLTAGQVRAARLLRAMTSPQKKLPRWRIEAPPPPAELLHFYQAAQRRTGVPWTYLAAIHLVETRMGRIRGLSTAGARGPMQFVPATWEVYGAGGDIDDPRDSILAAARLLRANGAPADMGKALWHYNQSESYVRAVSEYARTMQRSRSAYRGYWHWRVLFRHQRGTYVLPVGYPRTRPVLLPER